MPRTSVKGQVLADLMAEFAECPEEVETGDESVGEKVGRRGLYSGPTALGIVC